MSMVCDDDREEKVFIQLALGGDATGQGRIEALVLGRRCPGRTFRIRANDLKPECKKRLGMACGGSTMSEQSTRELKIEGTNRDGVGMQIK
jgi:hypothetical protein